MQTRQAWKWPHRGDTQTDRQLHRHTRLQHWTNSRCPALHVLFFTSTLAEAKVSPDQSIEHACLVAVVSCVVIWVYLIDWSLQALGQGNHESQTNGSSHKHRLWWNSSLQEIVFMPALPQHQVMMLHGYTSVCMGLSISVQWAHVVFLVTSRQLVGLKPQIISQMLATYNHKLLLT